MFTDPSVLALLKICLTFGVMMFAIRRHWGLWLALLAGAVTLGLAFGLSPLAIGKTMAATLVLPSFLTLFLVVACILILSEIQGFTGQGHRLVDGLTPYIKSPRVRLIFFPALVGLLPMPGGAVFSCPMVRDVAETLDVTEEQKATLNYWFRHIWEAAWPLYPGYILGCAVAGIPPAMLLRYTFPFVLISLAVGWVLLLRYPVKQLSGRQEAALPKLPFWKVLLEALPIVVAVVAAPIYDALLALGGITLPNGGSFVLSFVSAILVAMAQNHVPPMTVIRAAAKGTVRKMMLVVVMIFLFKEMVITAGVVDALAPLMAGKSMLFFLFLFLPALMGMLTGMMLGFVGAAFPLLIALLAQAGAYDERICWVMVALAAGHFGQMISPLHVCWLLTAEFFHTPLSAMWRSVAFASVAELVLAVGYTGALFLLVHPVL